MTLRPTDLIDAILAGSRPEVLAALPDARAEHFARRERFAVNGEALDTLYHHPPSRVRLPAPPPGATHFRFAVALHPDAWGAAGEGVRFEVRLGEGDRETALFSLYIDPKKAPAQRAWHRFALPLPAGGGPLFLAALPGPSGRLDFAWGGWGDPAFVGPGNGSAREALLDGSNPFAQDVAPFPPRAFQVALTSRCNLRCVLCQKFADGAPPVPVEPPDAPPPPPGEDAEGGFLEGLLPAVRLAERVELTGGGEPLLDPRLPRILAELRGSAVESSLTTNGTLLSGSRARMLLENGLGVLNVSLDAARAETYEGLRPGARFRDVVGNLEGFLRLRRELGFTRPRVVLVPILVRRNVSELPELVELAARLGADAVRSQPAQVYRRDLAGESLVRHPEAAREAVGKARDAARRRRIPFEDLTLQRLGLEPAPPASLVGAPFCPLPWLSATVEPTGRVRPCCLGGPVLGDLRAAPPAAVFNGRAALDLRAAWRMGLPPAECVRCFGRGGGEEVFCKC